MQSRRGKQIQRIVYSLVLLTWCTYLAEASQTEPIYAGAYLALALGSAACVFGAKQSDGGSDHAPVCLALSFLYALAVLFSNYAYFLTREGRFGQVGLRGFAAVAMLLGGVAAAYPPLQLLCRVAARAARPGEATRRGDGTEAARRVFLLCAASIFAVDLCVFLCHAFPGVLTVDSLGQVRQILTGAYTNHHPFYHTLVIRLWLRLGLALFGDLPRAVALYAVFQMLCMACVFAYAVLTLYQLGAPRAAVIGAWTFFALFPVHVWYSFTLWKDVLFAGMITLLVTSGLRLFYGVSAHKKVTGALFFGGALGMCLFRSNGKAAMAVTLVLFLALLRGNYRRMWAAMLAALLCASVLTGPVLTNLGVQPTESVEALSVPLQQVARAVRDGAKLTQEQEALLREAVDPEELAKAYRPWISDPVKNLLRAGGGMETIAAHKRAYARLYLQIGAAYPKLYLKAWIDQTCGYWNGGGYRYWIWAERIPENDLGLATRAAPLEAGRERPWEFYSKLTMRLPFLQPLIGLGLMGWLLLALFAAALLGGKRELAALAAPPLAVLLSLLVATPVAGEFRYAYVLPCVLPVLLGAVLCKKKA